MPTVLYAADVVCPMAGPPVSAGGVLVDGDRIRAVGTSAHFAADAGWPAVDRRVSPSSRGAHDH